MAFLAPLAAWGVEAAATGVLASGIETVAAGEGATILTAGGNAVRTFGTFASGAASGGVGAAGRIPLAGYATAEGAGFGGLFPSSVAGIARGATRGAGYAARVARRAAPAAIAGGVVTGIAGYFRNGSVPNSSGAKPISTWSTQTPPRNPKRPNPPGISPESKRAKGSELDRFVNLGLKRSLGLGNKSRSWSGRRTKRRKSHQRRR